MVGSLDEGVAVDRMGLGKFSDFYKLVVAKLQFFYKRAEAGPSASALKRDLMCPLALQDIYEWAEAAKADNVVIDTKMI